MGHFQQQTVSLPDGNDFDGEERWEMWSPRFGSHISGYLSEAFRSQMVDRLGHHHPKIETSRLYLFNFKYLDWSCVLSPLFSNIISHFWLYHNISHISYYNISYIHMCMYIYIYIVCVYIFIYLYICIYPMKIPYPILYLYHDKLLPLFDGFIRILLWPIF